MSWQRPDGSAAAPAEYRLGALLDDGVGSLRRWYQTDVALNGAPVAVPVVAQIRRDGRGGQQALDEKERPTGAGGLPHIARHHHLLEVGQDPVLRELGDAEVFGERPLAREIRCGGDVHQHRSLRAEELLGGLQHRYSRRGEPEPLVGAQVRVVGDDARHVGFRRRPRDRESQITPGLLGNHIDGLHRVEGLEAAVWAMHTPLQLE